MTEDSKYRREFEAAFLVCKGSTVKLKLRKKKQAMSHSKKAYIEALPMPLCVLDGEGDLFYANQKALEVLGDKEDCLYTPFNDIVGAAMTLEEGDQDNTLNGKSVKLKISRVENNYVVVIS